MHFDQKNPPRAFSPYPGITLYDHGSLYLAPDEQVTFVTASGKEHDFAAKSWGFYATPSVNGRLVEQGFKTALVQSRVSGRIWVMVVEQEQVAAFLTYLQEYQMILLEWLDERPAVPPAP